MSSVVPEGWQVSPLGSLAIVNWGNTSLTKDSYAETGFPAYSAAGNDGLVPNAEHTDVGVVLSAIGARCGRTFLTPQKWTAIKNTITILSDNQDIRFLYQVFNFSEVWNKSGGAQPFISLGDARKTPILHPPLPEQKKIASILTSVDEVIENTQKQIDKLQDLKKATMNELLTKGIGHTEFKDSELGRIPRSWEARQVQEIAKIIRGASPRPKGDPRYYGGTVPRLMGSDVTRDGKYVFPKTDFLTPEGAKLSRPMSKGGLTIVCSGTVGVPSILGVDACIHDGFLGLVDISNQCTTEFLYYAFLPLQGKFDSSATHGGVFTNLTTEILKEFIVGIPPLGEQREIVRHISSLDGHLNAQINKLSQTQSLKKSLMQDLLTGKVRVSVN